MTMKKVMSVAFFVIISLAFAALCPRPSHAATPSAASRKYAVLTVQRDEKTFAIELTLKVADKGGDQAILKNTVKDGITVLNRFEEWYEQLFALTYLDNGYTRLWKQLRVKGASLADTFLTKEMLDALSGSSLLVVVDKQYPFPADVFRIGDKWLFEIVPIVHSTTAGPKDLTDDWHYKSILILDCQGPKDREGQEAPGVESNLAKTPGIERHKLVTTLKADDALKQLEENPADVIHLATHADPDEFYPGRIHPGVNVKKLAAMKLNFHMFLSTGCNTGNPLFADAALKSGSKFFVASMYRTSGKDGIAIADVFYKELFSGKTPFESFYAVKSRIAGNKSDFPDVLRFVFYVK